MIKYTYRSFAIISILAVRNNNVVINGSPKNDEIGIQPRTSPARINNADVRHICARTRSALLRLVRQRRRYGEQPRRRARHGRPSGRRRRPGTARNLGSDVPVRAVHGIPPRHVRLQRGPMALPDHLHVQLAVQRLDPRRRAAPPATAPDPLGAAQWQTLLAAYAQTEPSLYAMTAGPAHRANSARTARPRARERRWPRRGRTGARRRRRPRGRGGFQRTPGAAPADGDGDGGRESREAH